MKDDTSQIESENCLLQLQQEVRISQIPPSPLQTHWATALLSFTFISIQTLYYYFFLLHWEYHIFSKNIPLQRKTEKFTCSLIFYWFFYIIPPLFVKLLDYKELIPHLVFQNICKYIFLGLFFFLTINLELNKTLLWKQTYADATVLFMADQG